MTLELASLPLAALAGALSILSPCVWPLVPVVMASAAVSGRAGPWFLALGLSGAFAIAGTLLTLLLLNFGLNPDAYRAVAAILLIGVGTTLLSKRLGDWMTLRLSRLTGGLQGNGDTGTGSAVGQLGVGALLGLVWLPCVGPTLGAAIALASLGQDLAMAFVVMLVFGLGTSAVLLLAGLLSARLVSRLRPGLLNTANRGQQLLGGVLLLLGVMVLTGLDKALETWALNVLPDWATGI